MVVGTKKADVLDIKFGDTVQALGGADTINVNQADSYYDQFSTPYGLIDGGTGFDTLVLNAPRTDDWSYSFGDLRSIERLKFTNAAGSYDIVKLTVPVSATGTVAAGAAMEIVGSTGGNVVWITVTGGMGSASAITMPDLTFTGFDRSPDLATVFGDDYIMLVAGDSSNYVLRASDVIGKQGIEQDLVGDAGNDTLIGSVGTDWFSGRTGADKMYGKSGDDGFALFGSDQPSAGDLFDGGSGNDFLFINGRFGPVTFAGTLVSIEGIRVGYNAELDITAAQMAMLPEALRLSGSNTGTLNITEATNFSAAKFVFLGTQSPTIAISGTDGANVLTGSSGVDILDGAGGADRLNGGAGADSLYGGDGADVLTGGAGGDAFIFDTLAMAGARDTIVDFRTFQGDFITLDTAVFTAVSGTNGHLTEGQFHAAAGANAAHDSDDRVIYNRTTGVLYYDADGLGGQEAIAFALLKGQPGLSASNILLL